MRGFLIESGLNVSRRGDPAPVGRRVSFRRFLRSGHVILAPERPIRGPAPLAGAISRLARSVLSGTNYSFFG
jgi:hypothetical protein